jgi:hypothetical protein
LVLIDNSFKKKKWPPEARNFVAFALIAMAADVFMALTRLARK